MSRLKLYYTLFPYTTLFRSLKGVIAKLGPHFEYLFPPRDITRELKYLYRMRQVDEKTIARGVTKGDLFQDRKSTRLNSSHSQNSYAVICLKIKNSLLIFSDI